MLVLVRALCAIDDAVLLWHDALLDEFSWSGLPLLGERCCGLDMSVMLESL